ncbi:unnamed protein product [Mytilus edulis]|uniref:DUF5641 domain-containing protein n=1 Tax=Mytilus edulis TaxID=6550 RepID=A0A8S3U004_MYTED|nr:unnamed protein product [Mytilus edulis]
MSEDLLSEWEKWKVSLKDLESLEIPRSLWLKGPPSVSCDESDLQVEQSEYVLIQPEQDKEVRPVVKACKTMVSQQLGTERFSRFSSWKRLVCAISKLRQIYIKYHREKHSVIDRSPVELYKFTEKFILKEVQKELYPKEVICLKNKQSLPKDSSILSLSPMLDDDGLLRVGGRLNRGNLSKTNTNYECFGHIDMREMYRSQWKKWKQQYLQNQQSRTKWCEERNNLKQGDIVLLKNNDLVRNQWSVGVILETFQAKMEESEKCLSVSQRTITLVHTPVQSKN